MGQSCELWRAPLANALRLRDAASIVDQASAQLRAGARALDLNVGVGGDPGGLAWAATVLSTTAAEGAVELWLDAAEPAVLHGALERLSEVELDPAPRLVVNALPVGQDGIDADPHELLHLAARAGAGAVLSPRTEGSTEYAAAERLMEELHRGTHDLRSAGLVGECYLDCLAYPAADDLPRLRRSLALLRLLRGQAPGDLRPLVAVGNVSHGAPATLRPALRLLYTAAAVGAGARALLLPVEERPLMDLLDLLADRRPARNAVDGWLRSVAASAEAGAAIEPPDAAVIASSGGAPIEAAWRLLFGGPD